MSLHPKQRTPFNISDIVAVPDDDFRGYGSDSSDKQKQILYIGSAPLERVVAFKAFFETIKLNLKKDVDIATYASRNFQIIKEKSGTMSYNVVLKIVGHTVNESMNNLAKIEELQRLILPSRATVGKYEVKEDKDKKKTYKKSQDFSFEGVSEESRTSLPLFFVHFRNIINSGHKEVARKIYGFKALREQGFPCHIANINYEPDVEAGFFDYNNFLWPKIITLNLTLNYESDNLFDEFRVINKKVIMPFQPNGHYSKNDSSLFPFGVVIRDKGFKEKPDEISMETRDFSSKEMNRLDLHSSQKGFVSIFLPGWTSSDKGSNKYDDLSNKKPRHIKFKPFIENFSRNVKTNVEMAHNANATINSRTAQHGIAFGGIEYSFKINIPSKDLDEAKKNCGKIQYLLRMFYKRYYDGTENLHVPDGMAYEDFRSKLMVYIPHMIEKTGGISTGAAAEYENSIPLFLQDLSFDIDLTAGFFEEEDRYRIFPKVMSLEFKFLYNRPDLINPLSRVGWGVYEFPESKKKSKVIKKSEYELFPLAKKTFYFGSKE